MYPWGTGGGRTRRRNQLTPVYLEHHTTTTTVSRPFFWDLLGEPLPEENFWTLWCKGRSTQFTWNIAIKTETVICACLITLSFTRWQLVDSFLPACAHSWTYVRGSQLTLSVSCWLLSAWIMNELSVCVVYAMCVVCRCSMCCISTVTVRRKWWKQCLSLSSCWLTRVLVLLCSTPSSLLSTADLQIQHK